MASRARTRATILAHHLYDFAECEHRIALDATLEREARTPSDEAMSLLFEHGRRFEREVAGRLGYAAVEVPHGDWDAAFTHTRSLIRDGVAGIDQGVLIESGRLARPDLLERTPGASAFGDFHYIPGDVKSARTPRSDAALQVGFAALLLETIQGRRPSVGFLILGDRRREEIDLDAIRCTVDDAVARAERIANGEAATSPFFSSACARCRWRDHCLPQLEGARDLSFVHGMTRARRRALQQCGIASIDDLAAADVKSLVEAGAPSEGLVRMRLQARTLLDGRVSKQRAVALSRGLERELYLRIETDPLDHGEPFLIACAESATAGPIDAMRIEIVSTPDERRAAFREILEVLESPAARAEPIYTYGGTTARAFDALAEALALDPARAGDLAGRFVDLAPWVRRAAVLPVFQYRFDEVAAVAAGHPRPAPGRAEDALFVLHAGLVASPDSSVRARLEEAGRDGLASLNAIRRWLPS